MRALASSLALVLATASVVQAEPIGRWWTGYGQGNFEYAIRNDSAGSDEFYIGCGETPTTITLTVGGVKPKADDHAFVAIGAGKFDLTFSRNGEFETVSSAASNTFDALWKALRAGTAMRVRLSTGQSTVFTLRGAAKVLPKGGGCDTSFKRPAPRRG